MPKTNNAKPAGDQQEHPLSRVFDILIDPKAAHDVKEAALGRIWFAMYDAAYVALQKAGHDPYWNTGWLCSEVFERCSRAVMDERHRIQKQDVTKLLRPGG
jgi:hypothetical protein